jgi:hypothetical protein
LLNRLVLAHTSSAHAIPGSRRKNLESTDSAASIKAFLATP